MLILLLTYLLTPWSRVLEKLTGYWLIKKLTAYYGTRRFITAFTSAPHLSLSSGRSIHYSYYLWIFPCFKIYFIFKLCVCVCVCVHMSPQKETGKCILITNELHYCSLDTQAGWKIINFFQDWLTRFVMCQVFAKHIQYPCDVIFLCTTWGNISGQCSSVIGHIQWKMLKDGKI